VPTGKKTPVESDLVERANGGRPSERTGIVRLRDGRSSRTRDAVAVEEPLEIRLEGEQVAVTMRTPGRGEDAELAIGFLAGEGIIDPAEVAAAVECRPEADGGVIDVKLRPGAGPRSGWQRNFYATSSCGICGKASIEAVRIAAPPVAEGPSLAADLIAALPERLRRSQRVFEKTGGLHAAGLFSAGGELQVLREDVGRHNAVDKAIGRALMKRAETRNGDGSPFAAVLQVSGRASFELVQKALIAQIPIVAAVSAPSSLAVRLAKESNMTLVGFSRKTGFNVYAGESRIEIGDEPPRPQEPETVADLLASARAELKRLTPAEAAEATGAGKAVLIDIRTESQRAGDGVIPDSVAVPRNVLEWRLDPASDSRDPELARRDRQTILICNEGFQSSLAAANLRRMGLDATDVIGGFQAWRATDLPVKHPS
jgi:FdhD protein